MISMSWIMILVIAAVVSLVVVGIIALVASERNKR